MVAELRTYHNRGEWYLDLEDVEMGRERQGRSEGTLLVGPTAGSVGSFGRCETSWSRRIMVVSQLQSWRVSEGDSMMAVHICTAVMVTTCCAAARVSNYNELSQIRHSAGCISQVFPRPLPFLGQTEYRDKESHHASYGLSYRVRTLDSTVLASTHPKLRPSPDHSDQTG
jgi:hypothetical protein